VSEVSGAVVVRLAGEAGVVEVPRLQLPFMRLVVRRAPLVVLDLSELTYISSLALGAVVALRRNLGHFGGRVMIAAALPRVSGVLETTRLHTLFGVYATVEEALAAGQ
jgi:anti-sigma B factor antagonist